MLMHAATHDTHVHPLFSSLSSSISSLFLSLLLPVIFSIHTYEIQLICSLFLLHNFTFTSALLSALPLVPFVISVLHFSPIFTCNFASHYFLPSLLDPIFSTNYISAHIFKVTVFVGITALWWELGPFSAFFYIIVFSQSESQMPFWHVFCNTITWKDQ